MKELQAPPMRPCMWIVKIRGERAQVVGPCRSAFDALAMYRKPDGSVPAFAELDYAEQVEVCND